MRYLVSTLLAAGGVVFAVAALAQSAAPMASMPPSPVVQTNPAPAAPVTESKRYACRASTRELHGQARVDQMQLCMAQARLDCLKQAIAQKIVGQLRKKYIKSCMQQ